MADAGTPVLVPGTPTPPAFPLARYRPYQLNGVVREFVTSASRPGDAVLVVGATGGAAVREVVDAQRRAIAVSRNPVDELCISLEISPNVSDELQTALSRLLDQEKAGRPFLLHLQDLYSSNCPQCGRSGTAEWFAWNRDSGKPFAKRVRCANCAASVEGPTSSIDLKRAGPYPISGGPAYHLALNRATEHSGADAERVVQLIQLYTSRNLGILMDIVNRLPRLHLGPEAALALWGLLVDAFDQGSVLSPYASPLEKPRSLRPPQRFLERNVWFALESAARAYDAMPHRPPRTGIQRDSVEDLLARPQPGYVLLNRSVKDLDSEELAAAFQALVIVLSPPDAAFWALSTLWSIWLSGDRVPAGLQRFLSRRRLDWDWYRRALAFAIDRVRPLLAPDAQILMLSSGQDPAAARAVTYATSTSALPVPGWIACPACGFRLVASAHRPPAGAPHTRERATAYGQVTTLEHILQLRGEPTGRGELTVSAILETGDHAFAKTEDVVKGSDTLIWVAEDKVWLRREDLCEQPLSDRLEEAILAHLSGGEGWARAGLERTVYGAFSGILSPDPHLVDGIIDAYTVEAEDGTVLLREEDQPQRRQREIRELRDALQSLGERLAYRVVRRLNRDLIWRDGKEIAYLFRFSATGILGPHLLQRPPAVDGQRCLVLPGGRASLIALKLRRDPRFQARVAADQWTFIKFRHLRRMIEEITQRTEIEVYLGLDPIVEQSGAQIPLPLNVAAR